MQSFLHCFWAGPSFPYGLRTFIKKWSTYLRKSNSDFQLVVWFTEDALAAFTQYMAQGQLGSHFETSAWKKHFHSESLNFNKVKINFNSFYICQFESLLTEHHQPLQTAFKLFAANKRYTSASNLARLMIINKCGGIYTDIDFLLPNFSEKFPKDIFQIVKVFKKSSNISFYLPITRLNSDHYLIENQCAILLPSFKGHLRELFDRIDYLLTKAYDEKLKTEVESEAQYQDSPVTKSLNKSLFLTGDEKTLLRAYALRNYDRFNYANNSLYKGQKIEGEFSWATKRKRVTDPAMLQRGMRHDHYDITGLLTYGVVLAFFDRHLEPERQIYAEECYGDFIKFFDEEHILSQFEFVDAYGDKHGMYSWANPGYGRLVKIEKSVRTLERYYTARPHLFSKIMLLNIFKDFNNSSVRLSDEVESTLGSLIQSIMGMGRNYLRPQDAQRLLKAFLSESWKAEGAVEEMLRLLNSTTYKMIRDLIDPEKTSLTAQDLQDFCII